MRARTCGFNQSRQNLAPFALRRLRSYSNTIKRQLKNRQELRTREPAADGLHFKLELELNCPQALARTRKHAQLNQRHTISVSVITMILWKVPRPSRQVSGRIYPYLRVREARWAELCAYGGSSEDYPPIIFRHLSADPLPLLPMPPHYCSRARICWKG